MKINSFEEIIAWQKAQELTVTVYKIFRCHKDFGFRDQIQRASVSIMNNIAEGFERSGDRELRKFLYISKGSCGEVRSLLYLARKLDYISEAEFVSMIAIAIQISRLLSAFIKTLH